ncbi:complement factor D [Platysternon megacephalum]|uniref:Complement factor D n=1 Tax=Platysternon megacephalum TaxID=55544 RepID=A0A4D9EB35_9SAUR|nr:complement factor D [Platysternon megacephalum]
MASKSLFIVAIDLGTSYSGYCFSLATRTDQIQQVFWGQAHGLMTVKTPTCIRFNEKREFKKFGYDAVMKYNTLPSSEAHKWYYFHHFKMAVQQGLISDMFSEKLVIALEPEAASVWCKQLPREGFVAEGGDRQKFEESPSMSSSIVEEIFQDGVWEEYAQNHPTECHQMMYNVGLQKWSFSRDEVYIHCYHNLTKVAERKQKDISLFFQGVEGALWCNGTIMITYEKMKSFFASSVRQTIGALLEILSKPEIAKVQYILLVGGFASSIILREEIYQTFREQYHILCPLKAQAAIAKGAVLFGHNPQIVASRISALTYGVKVSRAFDIAVHDIQKKRVSKADNYVYCTDLFYKLVGIGDSVEIHEVASYTFTPTEPDQTSVTFNFYCTEKDAKYVDEEGLKMLSSCTVPTPNTELGSVIK